MTVAPPEPSELLATRTHPVNEQPVAAPPLMLSTLLDRLPTTGDIMVKMSEDASLIELTLLCQDSAYVIQFYNDRIKTPATSFFSEELPAERTLIDFLKLNLDNILPPL